MTMEAAAVTLTMISMSGISGEPCKAQHPSSAGSHNEIFLGKRWSDLYQAI